MDNFSKNQKTLRLNAFAAKLANRSVTVSAANISQTHQLLSMLSSSTELGTRNLNNIVSQQSMLSASAELLCIACEIPCDGSFGAFCRSCSTSGNTPTPSAPLNAICVECNGHITNINSVRSCASCKKFVHRECDRVETGLMDDYVCHSCRLSPLVGDVMMPAPGPSSPQGMHTSHVDVAPSSSLDDFVVRSSTDCEMNELYNLPQHSGNEDINNVVTALGIASPATTTDSNRNSPNFFPEKSPSDDEDEFRPPGYQRGRGRGGAKKKPGRGQGIKTRSGGKPPTGTRGKRGKGSRGGAYKQNGQKGKGTRGRRGRGQLASSATSAVMQHLQSASYSTVKEVDETMLAEHEEARPRPEELDYVRTLICCAADDPFLDKVPLCLVCGSVGRGEEHSFVACSNCAQTYHTYCVNIHDKMRDTISKRGWRCLDCTVCEACGVGRDETKLLLCEECDTAFHIYCLDPALQSIPTGPWRCKWCARCRRCNIEVPNGTDLTREGLCVACNSLRKCPKCTKCYQLGDQIIRCSSCAKWCHGRCEGLYTAEDMETAALNKMRCSNCRPHHRQNTALQDGSCSALIIVDHVCLHKEASEIFNSKYMPAQFRTNSMGEYGSSDFRSMGSFDLFNVDEDALQEEISELHSGRGRGRGGGPGRRVPKLGVGGFFVKIPRHKMIDNDENEEDGVKKVKKPRKPRRSQLEDAYPAAIQEGFFGMRPVEGKQLLDVMMEEPVLQTESFDRNDGMQNDEGQGNQLSHQAAEALKNDLSEQTILDDVDLNFDLENFDMDFSNFMDDDEDDNLMDVDVDDDLSDAFAVAQQDGFDPAAARAEESSRVTQSQPQQQAVPSTSQIPAPSSQNLGGIFAMPPDDRATTTPYANMIGSVHSNPLSRSSSQMEGCTSERANATAECNSRWEEDEPLGEKATKAAVLFVNINHPTLKQQYPDWNDRVKQIQKIWRQLDGDNRQKYVGLARENRQQRGKVPRARRIVAGSQSSSVDSPTIQSPAPDNQFGQQRQLIGGQQQMLNPSFKVPNIPSSGPNGMVVPGGPQIPHGMRPPPGYFDQMHPEQQQSQPQDPQFPMQPPMVINRMAHLAPEIIQEYEQMRNKSKILESRQEVLETELTRMRKVKKSLTAKRRQILKNASEDPSRPSLNTDLNELDQQTLATLTEGIPNQLKEVENGKKEVKAHNQLTHEYEIKNLIPTEANPNPGMRLQQIPQQMGAGPGRPPFMQGHPGMGHPAFQQMRVPQQISYGAMMGPQGMDAHLMQQRMRQNGPSCAVLGRGSWVYERLPDQDARDVFECVDYLLSQVTLHLDGHDGLARNSVMLKRLLEPVGHTMHMNQPGPAHYNMNEIVEQPRPKKKRAQSKKTAGATGNEHEIMIERVNAQMRLCEKFPRRCLESTKPHDKMTEEPGRTDLNRVAEFGKSDKLVPDVRPMLGEHVGEMEFSFMDDYYLEDSAVRGPSCVFASEPSMNELAPYVDVQALMQIRPPSPCSIIYDEIDTTFGNSQWDIVKGICNATNRKPIVDTLRVTNCNVSYLPPLEPLRSAFTEIPPEPEDVEVSIVIREDEIKQLAEEAGQASTSNPVRVLFDRLSSILETKKEIEYTIDTPPLSPQPDNDVSIKQEIGVSGKCRFCDVMVESATIQQSSSRLGLTPPEEGKDRKVCFCTLKCYYMFIAASKVALSHDQLNIAEAHVDEETLSKLKQLTADNFAKVLQGKQASAPMLSDSVITSPKETKYTPNEEGRKEVVKIIRASELPNVVDQAAKNREAARASGDHPVWTVYDHKIVHTFQLIQQFKVQLATYTKHGVEFLPDLVNRNKLIDQRRCILCQHLGDGDPAMQGRLLCLDPAIWVHINCALWSSEVYENPQGGLSNVERAVFRSSQVLCNLCGRMNASIKCHKVDCHINFHLHCAKSIGGRFIRDRTFICPHHQDVIPEVQVSSLQSIRRVYIEKDETALLAKFFDAPDSPKLQLRLGALTFHSAGQLLPEQLKNFHDTNNIFPLGYSVSRLFWNPMLREKPQTRIPFKCSIREKDGKPLFVVSFDGRENTGETPTDAWRPILDLVQINRDPEALRFFPAHVTGEMLFGLNESAITKITESLPGVDTLYSYTFRHGGQPLLELPLAENPSGCARCEFRCRTLIKKHRARPSAAHHSEHKAPASTSSGEEKRDRRESKARSTYHEELAAAQYQRLLTAQGMSVDWASMYGKYCVEPNTNAQIYSAYQKMRKEWSNTVYLARSKIQGLGLYAKRDIDMGSMIIEYKGELIRSEVGEMREKRYTAQNRGVYMFRIDDEQIVDATMKGGCARYINHSCDPNCSTRIIQSGSLPEDKKIIITANRPIKAHEELTYDYQFEMEEDTKIPCLCGAPNCGKWMN